LFKIVSSSKNQEKVKKVCKKYNSVILDKSKKSFVIQITALRREIDKLITIIKPMGLISVSRTGAVAMTRGPEVFK
jgi:acetolactate synthase-1/3 small subunit